MAIFEHEVRLSSSDPTGGRRHLFTRDAYYAMGELGVFHDQRVELIEGEIIEKPPVSSAHAAICDPIAFLLRDIVGADYTVRTQAPVTLGDESNPSEPEPDVVVIVGPWRDYLKRRPNKNDVQLIVEIADSTLAYDRTIKARLYSDA